MFKVLLFAFALFDAAVEDVLERYEVPGMAVGIVANGEIVHMRGYGVRDVDTQEPVDENTLFCLASCSKAFTGYVLAELEEAGQIDLNAPANRYLSTVKLDRVRVVDLIAHSSGYPRYDEVWLKSRLSRKDLVGKLRYLKPTARPGKRWQYNNIMYAVLGELIEEVTGVSWEDQVRDRIFVPLGMTRSNTSVAESMATANFSMGHFGCWHGRVRSMAPPDTTVVGPACSVNSCVSDMVRWIDHQLKLGWGPNFMAIKSKKMPTRKGYGLGWFLCESGGVRSRSHAGLIEGFNSHVALWPDRQMGIVLLYNRHEMPRGLLHDLANTAYNLMTTRSSRANRIDQC